MNTDYSLADIAAATGNGGNSNDGFGENGSWWIILFLIFAIFGWGGNNGYGGFGGGGSQGAADNYVLASDFATLQRQLSDGLLNITNQFSSTEKGLDTIRNGMCDGFYTQAQLVNQTNMNIANNAAAITQAITTNGYENRLGQQMIGQQISNCCCDVRQQISDVNYNNAMNMNNVQRQISDCCCDTQRQIERGFADTNYALASQNCATLQAIDKVGDRILDRLTQDKIDTLNNENQALRLAASQQAQNNYLVNTLTDRLATPCPIPAYLTCNPNAPLNYSISYGGNGCCGCNG